MIKAHKSCLSYRHPNISHNVLQITSSFTLTASHRFQKIQKNNYLASAYAPAA
jgi:hypothetical protein